MSECKNIGLYRGKKATTGEWIEGGYIPLDVDNGYTYIVLPYHSASSLSPLDLIRLNSTLVIPETVGQCTGQPDKNGIKIFKGDIIKAFSRYDTQHIYDITYNNGTFWFGYWSWIEFLDRFQNPEIIGNIYDNPELLEGDDK